MDAAIKLGNAEMIEWGTSVLTTAVLSIIITAPIGALAIAIFREFPHSFEDENDGFLSDESEYDGGIAPRRRRRRHTPTLERYGIEDALTEACSAAKQLRHPLTLPRKVSTKARQTMSFANTVRAPLGTAVSRLSHTVTKSNTKPIANLGRKLAIPVIRNSSPELQSFKARIGAVSCLARRNYHTDIPEPDFEAYRSNSSKQANVSRDKFDAKRKVYSYTLVGGASAATVYMGKEIVQDLVGYLDINDAARAWPLLKSSLMMSLSAKVSSPPGRECHCLSVTERKPRSKRNKRLTFCPSVTPSTILTAR